MQAWCNLSKAQAALYEKAVDSLERDLQTMDGIQRRGIILAYLMQFKQICNHPAQYTGNGDFDPAASGKFDRLAELVEPIAARQEKLLVFTQFREMTDPLHDHLARCFGRPGLILHGGTPVSAPASSRTSRPTTARRSCSHQGRRHQLTSPPPYVVPLRPGGTPSRTRPPTAPTASAKRNVLIQFVCRGTSREDRRAQRHKQHLADALLGDGASSSPKCQTTTRPCQLDLATRTDASRYGLLYDLPASPGRLRRRTQGQGRATAAKLAKESRALPVVLAGQIRHLQGRRAEHQSYQDCSDASPRPLLRAQRRVIVRIARRSDRPL